MLTEKENQPRKYDLTKPEEITRLFREVIGYMKVSLGARCPHCRKECHEGTDFEGREFALQALTEYQSSLAKLQPEGMIDEINTLVKLIETDGCPPNTECGAKADEDYDCHDCWAKYIIEVISSPYLLEAKEEEREKFDTELVDILNCIDGGGDYITAIQELRLRLSRQALSSPATEKEGK